MVDNIKYGKENPVYAKRIRENDMAPWIRGFETAGLGGPGMLFFDAFFHAYGQSPLTILAGPTASKLGGGSVQLVDSIAKKKATPIARGMVKNLPGINTRKEWMDPMQDFLEEILEDWLGYSRKKQPGERGGKDEERQERQ